MVKFGIVCGSILFSIFISCAKKDNLNVEFSTSGCFGTCPILDVSIKENKVNYNVYDVNENIIESFYIKLDENEVNSIDEIWIGLNVDSLKTYYSNDIADGQRVKIKFKNQNKEIFYLAGSAPNQLEKFVDYFILLSQNKNHIGKTRDRKVSVSTRKNFSFKSPPLLPVPDDTLIQE